VKQKFVSITKNITEIGVTIEDLQKVYDSLLECGPDEEDFGWGPSYEFAMQRRDRALEILKNAIEEKKNDHF